MIHRRRRTAAITTIAPMSSTIASVSRRGLSPDGACASREAQDAERERDVRRHRDPPARGARALRHRARGRAAPGRPSRRPPRPPGSAAARRSPQLARRELALDLEPDDEEEQRHQAVVHPVSEVLADRPVAEPDRGRASQNRLVGRDPTGSWPRRAPDDRGEQHQDAARGRGLEELLERPQDAPRDGPIRSRPGASDVRCVGGASGLFVHVGTSLADQSSRHAIRGTGRILSARHPRRPSFGHALSRTAPQVIGTPPTGVYPRSRLDTATPRSRPDAAIPHRAARRIPRAAGRPPAVASRSPSPWSRWSRSADPAVRRQRAADRAGPAGRTGSASSSEGPGHHHQHDTAALGAERRGSGSRSGRQGDDGRALLPGVRRPGLVGRLRGGVRAVRGTRGRARRDRTPRSSRSEPTRTSDFEALTPRRHAHGVRAHRREGRSRPAPSPRSSSSDRQRPGGGTSTQVVEHRFVLPA